MKSKTFYIADRLNHESALKLAHTLHVVDGVKGVTCTAGSQINVDFNEDVTSTQEIQAVLERAGYPLRPAAAAHANGSCCGSCGG